MSLRIYKVESANYRYLALRVADYDEPIYVGRGEDVALAVAAMEPTDYGLSDFSPEFPTLKEVSETFADGAKLSVCKESDWKTAFRVFKEWKTKNRVSVEVDGVKLEENLFPKRGDFIIYRTEGEKPYYYACVVEREHDPVLFGKGNTPIVAVKSLAETPYQGADFRCVTPWPEELAQKFSEVVGPLDFCAWEEWDMALAALDERLQGPLY